MRIKKIYIFSFLFVIGTFVYGQDNSQKEAEIRSYCQRIEQMVPNTGAIAWGMIRQLNPTFNEKLVTVGQDGIKRIGLCQLPEDVLKIFADIVIPEYLYTAEGSINIVSGIYFGLSNLIKIRFSEDHQKSTMAVSIWFMLYGMDGMDDNKKPLSLDDINFIKVNDYAINFQKGIF